MSLFVEVYVGSKKDRIKIADIHAYNVSNLEDISDYEFVATEYGNQMLDIPPSEFTGKVEYHYRKQTVWSLVNKLTESLK